MKIIKYSLLLYLLLISSSCNKGKIEEFKNTFVNTPSKFVPSNETHTYICEFSEDEYKLDNNEVNLEFWKSKPEIAFDNRASDGKKSGLFTFVRFAWTENNLYFYVEVQDNSCDSENINRKQLWKGNNVEFIFTPKWYSEPFYNEYEFLFNCFGDYIDLHWLKGSSLNESLEWEAEGMEINFFDELVFHNSYDGWCFEGKLPFATLKISTPQNGEHWGMGLFRCHQLKEDFKDYLAWSPPLNDPVKFHKPSSYGKIIFDKHND